MGQEIIVINWMAFILLVPASIMAWKMVVDKLKGKGFSSDLKTLALLLGAAFIGVLGMNIVGRAGWLRWTLLLAQFILFVVLFKRLWRPFKQMLRGWTHNSCRG